MSETRPYDIDVRLLKGRESVLRCKTKRELLAEVKALEELAYGRGYSACENKWLRRQASATEDLHLNICTGCRARWPVEALTACCAGWRCAACHERHQGAHDSPDWLGA